MAETQPTTSDDEVKMDVDECISDLCMKFESMDIDTSDDLGVQSTVKTDDSADVDNELDKVVCLIKEVCINELKNMDQMFYNNNIHS